DTNIWISGLLWGGNPRLIIQLGVAQEVIIYSSKLLIDELQATLAYPKLQRRHFKRKGTIMKPIVISNKKHMK
ncbi:MAG: putative toxin-antitoxin system toxin component, PIN family, partial [Pleurocapsa sp.]